MPNALYHTFMANSLEEGKTKSSIIQVNLTKSGYAKSSLLASAEEFDNMISFACRRIEDAGESIRKGDISLNPYRQGDHTGCDFCSYMDICRFRAGRFGTDWREEEKSKEEMEAEVYGRDKMA